MASFSELGTPAPQLAGGFGRELRAVVRLALPVVLVQLGLMFMGTVDSLMLGHLSAQALAAGALGYAVSITLLMGFGGILLAIDPLVSQAFGAGDGEAIGAHLERGLVLAVALAVPLTLIMWDLEGALLLLGQRPEVAGPAAAYIRGVAPGNAAFLGFLALRQTLQAMSVVRPAFVAMIAGNVVNALANWILIFGYLGAPRLGVVGSAYSTAIGRWAMLAVAALAARRALAPYWRGFTRRAREWREHGRILALGTPIGLMTSLEFCVFTTVALLMGRLGVRELAGHQIALNLAALSYMVPAGIAAAAATRVGNAIGRDDMPGARRAAAVCLALGAGVMAVFALVFALAPRLLARLYSPEPEVVAAAAALIPIAALFQVFDGTQVVGAGVLRGTADTRVPAAVALFGYWVIALPLGVWLGLHAGYGPRGLWGGLTLGLATVAVLLVARVVQRFRGRIERVGAPVVAGAFEAAPSSRLDP